MYGHLSVALSFGHCMVSIEYGVIMFDDYLRQAIMRGFDKSAEEIAIMRKFQNDQTMPQVYRDAAGIRADYEQQWLNEAKEALNGYVTH